MKRVLWRGKFASRKFKLVKCKDGWCHFMAKVEGHWIKQDLSTTDPFFGLDEAVADSFDRLRNS